MKIQPKDRKEFNKLLNEITDIMNGAHGSYLTVEQWNDNWLELEDIPNVVRIINEKYEDVLKERFRLLEVYDIAECTKPAKLTLFLYNFDVRAVSNGSEADIDWDKNT